ncbi:hypothetical protein [Halomonas campaniensis]|uniref:hypothetical protein n=1 Tax=Halomonas campaniensis TaxID=213554 RepID=UPI001483AAE7|nr:hypothetical protein [Halomonas campaniensis]
MSHFTQQSKRTTLASLTLKTVATPCNAEPLGADESTAMSSRIEGNLNSEKQNNT